MNFGALHVVLVHFPIAFVLGAFLADFIWLVLKKENFRVVGLYCLVLAAISAIPTIIAGLLNAQSNQFTGDYVAMVATHKTVGIIVLVGILIALSIRLILKSNFKGVMSYCYGVVIIALAVAVTITGHYGGMLVHGKGFLDDVFKPAVSQQDAGSDHSDGGHSH